MLMRGVQLCSSVSGTAAIGGATVNAIYAHGAVVEKYYTILSAGGGVNGTFNDLINTKLPVDFTASLAYDANNAFLNVRLSFEPGPSSPDFGKHLNGFPTITSAKTQAQEHDAIRCIRICRCRAARGAGIAPIDMAA